MTKCILLSLFFSLSAFLFLFYEATSFAALFFRDSLGNPSLRLWKNSGSGCFHGILARRQKPAGLCAICTAGGEGSHVMNITGPIVQLEVGRVVCCARVRVHR